VAIFKYLNPLIHNSIRDSIGPIPSTHGLMNLSTWYAFCLQNTYLISLLLLGAILNFRCHVHFFVALLTPAARSTGLLRQPVTRHLTNPHPHTHTHFPYSSKI
jgi:hypothetical protein